MPSSSLSFAFSLQPNSGKTKKGNPTMLLLQPPRSCCPSLSRGCCGPASTSAPSAPLADTRREHHRNHHHRRRHRLVSASAASSSSSSSPEPSDAASPSPAQPSSSPQMSLADAHAALGVAEGAQFDLVSAKNRALADAKGNGEKLAKVRISRMLLSFFLLGSERPRARFALSSRGGPNAFFSVRFETE